MGAKTSPSAQVVSRYYYVTLANGIPRESVFPRVQSSIASSSIKTFVAASKSCYVKALTIKMLKSKDTETYIPDGSITLLVPRLLFSARFI